MGEISVRPARNADLPRLMGMDHGCESEYVWQLDLQREPGQHAAAFREVRLPRPVRLTYPRDPYALADEWKRHADMLVAASDNTALGYVRLTMRDADQCAWITDLAVTIESRRHGVGVALVQAAQDWARERGARRLILEASSKNQPAIRLGLKLGFEICGYNDQYYANGDVAIFLGKSLPLR